MSKTASARKVLIFGGAGFIGSNWARRLLETSDARVHVFDNLSRPGVRHNLRDLQEFAESSKRLTTTVADIRDAAAVERAVRSASEIYHFAAQVAVTSAVVDPQLDFSVNVCGTFNILEAARKCGHKPFLLFTSTNKVYGTLSDGPLQSTPERYLPANPEGISEAEPLDFHSPYGCSKGAADQYVRDYARIYQIPTVVFRMSCIAGPHQFGNEDQGWVAHFLYSTLQGRPTVIYGDGRQVRDVLCVHDLLRAFEMVRRQQQITSGQIYNIGGGPQNTISILELMREIKRLTGYSAHVSFSLMRPGDQLLYVTDFRKLRHDTGWQPRMNVGDTLQCMYGWWRSHSGRLEQRRASAGTVPGLAEVAA
jgi:CDP-paratose 2-epimerase